MNNRHPFRFGLNGTTPLPQAWIDTAQKAEALGFLTSSYGSP